MQNVQIDMDSDELFDKYIEVDSDVERDESNKENCTVMVTARPMANKQQSKQIRVFLAGRSTHSFSVDTTWKYFYKML